MNNLINLESKEFITSLELLEQINFFRKENKEKTELGHNDLLKIIRDEFSEEISLGKISQSNYKNDRGREYPMFKLTLSQAKQVLVRESKFVRKSVIAKLEQLEKAIENKPMSIQDMMIATLEEQKKTNERVNIIEYKLDNEIRIDSGEQRKLQKAVGTRVYQRMEILNNYENKKLMFLALYRDIKNRFGVASYRDIKRKDFKDVLEYVSCWIEPVELRIEAS